ncbi:MAG: RNA polymerase sigma-70 factor [Cyclobacteriaceae bacterium]
MTEENEIVRKIIEGEEKAFEIVFNKYYKRLCAYAARFVYTDDTAEEVVQEVFVRFWEKSETLKPDSSLAAYLYRSVYNTCLNLIKHEKVKDSYRDYVRNFMDDQSDELKNAEEQEELFKQVVGAIDELPPRCSEIFKLSRFEGLKYQEIAEHLGISLKTVEVQMGKALRVLREKFKK